VHGGVKRPLQVLSILGTLRHRLSGQWWVNRRRRERKCRRRSGVGRSPHDHLARRAWISWRCERLGVQDLCVGYSQTGSSLWPLGRNSTARIMTPIEDDSCSRCVRRRCRSWLRGHGGAGQRDSRHGWREIHPISRVHELHFARTRQLATSTPCVTNASARLLRGELENSSSTGVADVLETLRGS